MVMQINKMVLEALQRVSAKAIDDRENAAE
jgi:hypothetical protein